MASIKCISCGLVNFATAANCKRCQQPLHEMALFADQRPYRQGTQQPPQQPPQQYGQGYQNQPPAQQYNQPPQQYGQPQYNQPPQQFVQRHQNPPPQQRMPDFNSPPPPPVFHEGQPTFQPYEMPPPPPGFQGQQPMYHPPQPPMNCIKCGTLHGSMLQSFKKDYVPPLCYLGVFAGLIPLIILIAICKTTHVITAPFCGECWPKFRNVRIVETLTTLSFIPFIIMGIIAGIALNSVIVFFVFLAGFVATAIYGHNYKKTHSPKFKKIDSKIVMVETPTFGVINLAGQTLRSL